VAALDKNVRAHLRTYFGLVVLKELEVSFNDAGNSKVTELRMYQPNIGADALRQNAEILAHQLDNFFRMIHKAILEPDKTLHDAIGGLVNVLIDRQKTIFDVAQQIDSTYLFVGEGSQ
jgi:hypothetical protein